MSEDAPTNRHVRNAIRVSPDAQVLVKVGSMLTGAGALVVATIFVWGIKSNSEQALAEIKAVREDIVPAFKKIDRLWWDYENRTASRSSTNPGAP